MAKYKVYNLLQKYECGIPVYPPEYEQGQLITSFEEYDSIEDCENTKYYMKWVIDEDKFFCDDDLVSYHVEKLTYSKDKIEWKDSEPPIYRNTNILFEEKQNECDLLNEDKIIEEKIKFLDRVQKVLIVESGRPGAIYDKQRLNEHYYPSEYILNFDNPEYVDGYPSLNAFYTDDYFNLNSINPFNSSTNFYIKSDEPISIRELHINDKMYYLGGTETIKSLMDSFEYVMINEYQVSYEYPLDNFKFFKNFGSNNIYGDYGSFFNLVLDVEDEESYFDLSNITKVQPPDFRLSIFRRWNNMTYECNVTVDLSSLEGCKLIISVDDINRPFIKATIFVKTNLEVEVVANGNENNVDIRYV